MDHWKVFNGSLVSGDVTCSNCEFNFDGMCAAHNSLYGYGKIIVDDDLKCEEWGASLSFFGARLNELKSL